MTAKTVLTAALATLRDIGITEGRLVRDTDTGRCYCSLGAIALASGCEVIPDPNQEYDWRTGLRALTFDIDKDGSYYKLSELEAVVVLARTINPIKAARHVMDADGNSSWNACIVSGFNDTNAHNGNYTPIYDMFEKAIASLDNDTVTN